MSDGLSHWFQHRALRISSSPCRASRAADAAVVKSVGNAESVDARGGAGSMASGGPRARRVLMLSFYFPPSNLAGVFRSLRFVKYLPDYGWQPLVIAAEVDETAGGYDAGLLDEIPDQTVVRRTPVRYPDELIWRWMRRVPACGWASSAAQSDSRETDPNRAVGRNGAAAAAPSPWSPKAWARHLWDLALLTPDHHIWWRRPARRAAHELCRRYRPQLIFSTGPPHSTHLIALRIKRRTRLPWVMDMRDPWSTKPWGYKVRNPWGQRLHPAFEAKCIRHANRVLLNTHRMRDDFVARYPAEPATKFRVLTNGYDPSLSEKLAESATMPHAADDGRHLLLCHPGSLYGQRDPRGLISALKLLRDEGTDVRLEQIGGCSQQFGLEALIAKHRLERVVTVRQRVPHDTLLKRMAAADVLVVVQPETAIQVPAKLFEMLLFHKPIVALTGDGETANIVRSRGLGRVASPDSAPAIAEAIRGAAAMRPIDHAAWRRAIADFDGQRLTGMLAETLNQFCASPCVR